MKFWESLSEQSKPKWAELWKDKMGQDWVPPERDKRAIKCETKLEDTTEIDKLMREKPGYSVDVQGREG